MVDGDRQGTLIVIGDRVRARRRQLELTQEKLAEAAELSKSFVSEVEGGQAAATGLVYLRIAQALDVDVQWLLTGEGAAARPPAGPVEIPELLSQVAEEKHWSHRRTLDIAAALQGIVARRTRGGQKWELNRDLILKIASALRDEKSSA